MTLSQAGPSLRSPKAGIWQFHRDPALLYTPSELMSEKHCLEAHTNGAGGMRVGPGIRALPRKEGRIPLKPWAPAHCSGRKCFAPCISIPGLPPEVAPGALEPALVFSPPRAVLKPSELSAEPDTRAEKGFYFETGRILHSTLLWEGTMEFSNTKAS